MKIIDLFNETYASLTVNKVRTGLTMLGIVIGISSVIAMVSIGQGAQAQIQTSIEGLGSNLLSILPGVVQPGRGIVSSGRGAAQTLKNEDVDLLRSIEGLAAISPESSRRFQIVAPNGNNTNTTVTGGQTSYGLVHNLIVANGSFISDADDRSISRKAVLGATVAADLFLDTDPVGQAIRVNNVTFTVIGVLQAKGAAGFSGPDDMVIVPLSTMQKILAGIDYLSTITVSVADKDQINDVRDQMISLLLVRHRVAEPDFSVISQADVLGTLSSIITTFTLFLASIAGISLLVGGIGIMNMMLTTVTERTREIGLRKAIGAQKRDITAQFLTESVMLTFVGGVAGIALGWLIATLVSQFAGIATSVSFSAVMLAFGVSATIGIVFGYYPARRAAGLNPIEALRYE